MTARLEGQSVIVTGAARGVGLAIARAAARAGAKVMMTARDETALTAEREALAETGADVRSYDGDLSQKLTVANLISATIDAFDRIDVLINASRDMQPSDPLDVDNTTLGALLDSNVMTPLRLTQQVVKRMNQLREDDDTPGLRAVVNIGSIAAQRTLPELMAFSVASAALDQMTRSMAVAFAPYGTRVNEVALGSVMSSSLRDAIAEQPQLQDRLTSVTPLGRIGDGDEAAEMAVFLASDAASFVTGQIIAVDGGRTILDPMQVSAH